VFGPWVGFPRLMAKACLILGLAVTGAALSIVLLPAPASWIVAAGVAMGVAALFAWAIGRVISSLPLTPGGIGFVELGMIGTLVGFGAPHAHVVAAVLLYRGLIIFPTLVVGAAALVGLRFKPSAALEES